MMKYSPNQIMEFYDHIFGDLEIPYESISEATKGFTTIVGSGGGGDVYLGELPRDGETKRIAVKRLQSSREQLTEFTREYLFLSYYTHENIVPVGGYCYDVERDVFLIVYDYAEGRSLDNYLNTACPLTWKQRIKICIDVACGLDYLHNNDIRQPKLIHKDIKSANIVLDRNLKAMIADFGLSVPSHTNENKADSNVSGTPGYWDPVYIKTGILTFKSDVYSFGVVLFELLCGRLCFKNVIGEQRDLVPLARRCYEQGRLKEIMDLDLKDSESMKEFSKIAYQCVEDDPEGRPTIDLVLQKLKEVLKLQASEETAECDEQGDQVSELQDFRVRPASLTPQALGVHNDDQQWLNQLPSQGFVRPIQGTLINQLQKMNVNQDGIGQSDGKTDEKLMSLTDFCYRNATSTNQDRDISSSEYDENGQPISIGMVAKDRFSNPSIVIGDPYAGDKAFSISDLARPQPSQTRESLTNKENDDET